MQYLGGKTRIAKHLAAYLERVRAERYFVEPFCGALNITRHIRGARLAADASPYLFSLYKSWREGWRPPDVVTREMYERQRVELDPSDPLTAFIGYGCSFGGKFFGGYADGPASHSKGARATWDGVSAYPAAARRGLEKKMEECAEASFSLCSYDRLSIGSGILVYCDPPYEGTEGYEAVGSFDSSAFWQRCREWSKDGAIVLVSEYRAPPDFEVVWSMPSKTDMHGKGREGTTENLYRYAP